ncbi:MAG: GNAT family N-acetyltransferase [Pseudanabaenaceae cyanobacterium]|jgi:hypothetical protein
MMSNFPAVGSTIRPLQYRDLQAVDHFAAFTKLGCWHGLGGETAAWGQRLGARTPLVSMLSWLPSSLHPMLKRYVRAYVLECNGIIQGFIQVSPFNHSRSTWQIDRMAIANAGSGLGCASPHAIGTQLIRHCLEACWEARMWLLMVDVNQNDGIALYRQNGFQPLAQFTEWEINGSVLEELAANKPDLPNLMAVSNADAGLLYQLDTAAMPPQIRQVYDLGISDFRCSPMERLVNYGTLLLEHNSEVSGYVFEPQRKAAIGYFNLLLHRSGQSESHQASHHHRCQLTVHPAYTWLYPDLMGQIASIVMQVHPKRHDQTNATTPKLMVSSTDYQPEREAYLEQIQAHRHSHHLLMGRSVWHKVRETKPVLDALQLSRMLSGLQPAHRPVPGRIETPPQPPTPHIYPNPWQFPDEMP